MKHASVGIALSTLAFALALAVLAADALGDPRVGVTSATTGANDRAHLLFLDRSSLTVGPRARLTVDRFVYDPSTRSGALAVTVGQGVLRFVVFGSEMKVVANGRTQVVSRPGWQVTTHAGKAPGRPSRRRPAACRPTSPGSRPCRTAATPVRSTRPRPVPALPTRIPGTGRRPETRSAAIRCWAA